MKKKTLRVEYSSNNSGGDWWLSDENWKALEAAGWKVNWFKDQEERPYRPKSDRWLGALATNASRTGLSLGEAIEEFERVTGQQANALGCSCCGTPHSFYVYDENDKMVDSYSPDYPSYGAAYGG